ncbi:ROK family protein [Desemzia sp. FAM 23991]|uniref:ROK family protein n=1 Tax=unclassified Desemzia TaxID=2685243 RepID=UPI00388A15AE
MKSQKPNDLKQHNVQAIRKLFMEQQHDLTKTEIARLTSLSVVTTNKLISEMIAAGELVSLQQSVFTGGRKAMVYQLNKDYKTILTIRFYETDKKQTALLRVSNLRHECIVVQTVHLTENTMDSVLNAIKKLLNEYSKISVIVIGIPGVEMDGNFKIMDFSSMKGINIRARLKDMTDLPVIIENDINAATYGFAKENSTEEIVAGLYCLENYPPGSAVVIQDRIFCGANGLSGELKHLSYYDNVHFPVVNRSKAAGLVEQSLRTIISMYDPHEVVIFDVDRFITTEIWAEISARITQIFPYGYLAKVTIYHDVAEYYLMGLNELGLKLILEQPF